MNSILLTMKIQPVTIQTGSTAYQIRCLQESDYKAFSAIIKEVFSLPPWDEKLTEEEVLEEFKHCTGNGFILGAFSKTGELMGIAEFIHEFLDEHAPYIPLPSCSTDSAWYIHGLATLPKYRSSNNENGNQLHVCTNLVQQGLLFCKDLAPKHSDYCYFRISEHGSMSKGLGERQGFVIVRKEGEISEQIIDPNLADPYRNFMIKDLRVPMELADYSFMYETPKKYIKE